MFSDYNLLQGALADFSNGKYASRQIQAVELPSGEQYIFYVDQIPDGADRRFQIKKTVNGTEADVAVQKIDDEAGLPVGMRTLLGCRTSIDSAGITGPKWIGWKSEDEGDENLPYKFYPFFEPYSYTINYNKAKNQIFLFFWTNLFSMSATEGEDPETEEYRLDRIAYVRTDGTFYFPVSSEDQEKVDQNSVHKVLFCSVGKFIKASLDASVLPTSDDNYDFRKCVDYVPIFQKPFIVHSYVGTDSVISDIADVKSIRGPWQIDPLVKNVTPSEGDPQTKITLKDCVTRTGSTTYIHNASMEVQVPSNVASLDLFYVGIKIDTNSNAVEIIFGATLGEVTDTSPALQGLFHKIPLYRLRILGKTVNIDCDFRLTPIRESWE